MKRRFPPFIAILAMILSLGAALPGSAQIVLPFNREKQAFKLMDDGQWKKSRQIFEQVLEKDSTSVEARLGLAKWFFNPANPRYSLDSARSLSTETSRWFQKSDSEEREKLNRFPIDSLTLATLSRNIEEETYRRTVELHSLEGYNRFLSLYPASLFKAQVVRPRDSIAFAAADKRKSSGAMLEFLNTYPESLQAKSARARYDRLVFEEITAPGTPDAFETFLNRFPLNPWRDHALEIVFAARTRDGKPESFQWFAQKYPGNTWAERGLAINRHRNLRMGRGRWIPFVEKNKIGFIGIDGRLLLSPRFDALGDEVRCSPGDEGIFLAPDGGYSRDGRRWLTGSFSQIEYIGCGFFISASKPEHKRLHHLEGWEPFNGNMQSAVLLDGRFLGIRHDGLWEFRGLNGSLVLPHEYDSVYRVSVTQDNGLTAAGSLIILRRHDRYYLLQEKDLIAFAEGRADFRTADEITPIGEHHLLLRIGFIQEVVDDRLKTVIPPDRQTIRSSPAGFLVEKNGLIRLIGWSGLADQVFEKVDFRSPWMRTTRGNTFRLFNLSDQSVIIPSSDSIWFDGTLAFARAGDSVRLVTPQNRLVTIGRSDQVRLIVARDSSVYYLVRNRSRLLLYDAVSTQRVVQGAYTDIVPVSRQWFMVRLRNKWGLVKTGGKELLQADYDAIIFQNGWFSLLRDGRFGGYNPSRNLFLKTMYDANLVVFSEDLMLARKSGRWGFIKPTAKSDKGSEFLYQEVKPLSDSLVLVRQAADWTLMRVYEKTAVQESIQSWTSAGRPGDILFRAKNLYGVLRPDGESLIAPRYSEIDWITDDQQTLYIAFMPPQSGKISVEYINELGITVRRTEVNEDQLDLLLCED